jgi:predicted Fe-Mo cluster-binding NifX family protein
MKIAVASENEVVTQHFGYCQTFTIYNVKDNKITETNNEPNPGHEAGFLPRFLGDMQVTTIISGGMGNKAVELFNAQGIEVVIGASGASKQAALDFIEGKLKSTGVPCSEHNHDHKGDC